MVYKWAEGSRVASLLKAQVAGSHLEKLRRKNGQVLTPKIVVDDARQADSPLHPVIFQLNDSEAAEKWRENVASYILRSIVLVASEEGEDERTIRAFVSVIEDEEPVYTSVIRAMKDEDLRAQVLAEAKLAFEELRRKYKDLVEFSEVYSALDLVKV